MQVDGHGKYHVAYEHLDRVWYLTNRSGSWVTAPIGSHEEFDRSHPTSLVVSNGGKVYIAYQTAEERQGGDYKIHNYWVTNATGYWVRRSAAHFAGLQCYDPDCTDNLTGSQIALYQGRVHLVYAGRGELWWRTYYSYGPITRKVGGSASHGSWADHLDLAVDDGGRLHIAQNYRWCGSVPRCGTYYWTNKSGSWVRRMLAGRASSDPAIAVTPAGTPHVVYGVRDSLNRYLIRFARLINGAWQYQYLTGPSASTEPDIALSDNGRAHVVHRHFPESGSLGIRYLTNQSGSWTSTVFPDEEWFGGWPTIDVLKKTPYLVWASSPSSVAEQIYYLRFRQN